MTWWLATAAIAGPLGPFDDATDDTGIARTAACTAAWSGELDELLDAPALYRRSDPNRAFGREVLIEVIEEATARVAATWPDADPVLVGDLSLRRGGPFPPHKLHDVGLSADLGLFTGNGSQPAPGGFLSVAPEDLDLPRTWTLLESLLETGRVRFILLDQRHIDRLAAWLRTEGWLGDDDIARIFPDSSMPALWTYEGIIRHAAGHGDHVHLELNCG